MLMDDVEVIHSNVHSYNSKIKKFNILNINIKMLIT